MNGKNLSIPQSMSDVIRLVQRNSQASLLQNEVYQIGSVESKRTAQLYK